MNKVTRIKNANYTTISNVFLRDKELSLKAKGLLATILSLPENWDFSIKGICATIKEGTTAVYSAIDELKERGYCKVVTNRNGKGMIVGNDYTFYEDPSMENLNVGNQTQINTNISLPNTKDTDNKEKKKEEETNKELFEQCWIAYRRKGSKKKAFEYWKKLTDVEKQNVMPHIKAYVSTRELQFQKDFERYLRDKIFQTVVFSGNNVVYDPTKLGKGESASNVYMPSGNFSIMWDDRANAYIYIGYYNDSMGIADGYTNDNRPDGATIILNNGRGTITWNSETKTWDKI